MSYLIKSCFRLYFNISLIIFFRFFQTNIFDGRNRLFFRFSYNNFFFDFLLLLKMSWCSFCLNLLRNLFNSFFLFTLFFLYFILLYWQRTCIVLSFNWRKLFFNLFLLLFFLLLFFLPDHRNQIFIIQRFFLLSFSLSPLHFFNNFISFLQHFFLVFNFMMMDFFNLLIRCNRSSLWLGWGIGFNTFGWYGFKSWWIDKVTSLVYYIGRLRFGRTSLFNNIAPIIFVFVQGTHYKVLHWVFSFIFGMTDSHLLFTGPPSLLRNSWTKSLTGSNRSISIISLCKGSIRWGNWSCVGVRLHFSVNFIAYWRFGLERGRFFGLLRNGLFCQFQELVVELCNFFDVGVIHRAELLEKLEGFSLFELGMDSFDVVLQIALLLWRFGQIVNLFLKILCELLQILGRKIVDFLEGRQLTNNHSCFII